jgi:predicted TIM-barrel fold metal-dependent hydrolase
MIAYAPSAYADPPRDADPRTAAMSPEVWRRECRTVDMHMHIDGKLDRFDRAVRIMDAAGIGVGIELGSGTVTHDAGKVSEFERVKQLTDTHYPGRFLHYMLLDYAGWDRSDWSEQAARQIEEGHRLGAAGLKEFKRLGLVLRDGQGKLIKVDDPKLDPVWAKCGELGMPVSIHIADPKAFWEPLERTNERWEELRDHPQWWFGDRSKYPPRVELIEALSRVIQRHPQTTFVAVHFANNAEDLEWVDRTLTQHPNMMADIAARVPEIGRHPSDKVHDLFVKYQDRLLFGTDFMVYDRLTLGSAGDAERPTDIEALTFFKKHWRFLETRDRDWRHMTPIQGNWTISSIDLPSTVLRKIYFDNARKLLARSWPLPVMAAKHIDRDFDPNGRLDEAEWAGAPLVRLEYGAKDAKANPALSTAVRVLWSNKFLYLAFESPFTTLSAPSPSQKEERMGLWDFDVVEAFIAPHGEDIAHYSEYEWAPNGEQLDVKVDRPDKDFAWSSRMESATSIDEKQKIWRIEARIPVASISKTAPQPGTRWRMNLFRHDKANHASLAWSPTLTDTFHSPAKFGWLDFRPSATTPVKVGAK